MDKIKNYAIAILFYAESAGYLPQVQQFKAPLPYAISLMGAL
jgi:hypothetical protein